MPATVAFVRFQSRAWPAPTGERDAPDCSSADQKFIFSFAPAQRGGPNTWMVYLPKDEMSYE